MIKLDIEGITAEVKEVEARLAVMTDLRDFWNQQARPILVNEIEVIFERAGSPPWPRRKVPAAHPLLRRTGRLYNSLTKQGPDHVSRATPKTYAFGTAVPYARYLEHGTKSMPARPFIGTLAKSQRGAHQSIKRRLREALATYLEGRGHVK